MTWTKATDDCWILGAPHDPEASVVREGRAFVAAVYQDGMTVEVGRYTTLKAAKAACAVEPAPTSVEGVWIEDMVAIKLMIAACEAVRLRRGDAT